MIALAMGLIFVPFAAAQRAPAGPDPAVPESRSASVQLAPVEVTGQRVEPFSTPNLDLPRTSDDAQPYYFFEAQTIERSGASSLEQFIRDRVTMGSNGGTQDQSVFIGGTQSVITLRGLFGQTLILINGRPAAPINLQFNGGAGTDLNGIPLAAVDHIELLPSSASAIYGGGAVAGVVNVVLKRTFSGGEVRLTYQNPFDTDAPVRRVDMSYGFALERGRTQVMLGASWSDRGSMLYQDRLDVLEPYERGFYANDLGNPTPGVFLGSTPNIRSATGANLTLKSGGALGSPITFIPFGTAPDTPLATLAAGLLANAGQTNFERPDTVQMHGGRRAELGTRPRLESFMATVRRSFGPQVDAFVEFSYSGTFSRRNSTNNVGIGTIAASAARNPFNQAVTMTVPLAGDYPVWSNNLTRRVDTGVIVKLPRDWKVVADYTWTASSNAYWAYGTQSGFEIPLALTAGTLNPFVDTKLFPLDLDAFNSTTQATGGAAKNLVALRASGPLGTLPAGRSRVTVGLDRRRDGLTAGFNYVDFPRFPARNVYRYATGKTQTTTAAYLEADIPLVAPAQQWPLLRQVDLQLAGRTERYEVRTGSSSVTLFPVVDPTSAAGKVIAGNATYRSTDPTAAVRWWPIEEVMLRAGIARGFIPPSSDQLLENPDRSTFTSTIIDPRRARASYGVFTLSGGNRDLEPETSDSTTFGVVLTPPFQKQLRFSADWTRLSKKNNIGALTLQQMVDNEALFPPASSGGPPTALGSARSRSSISPC
jgi:iron complex outermembrane receptor protein